MKELVSRKNVLIVSFILIFLMIFYIKNYWSTGLYQNNSNSGLSMFITLNDFLPFMLLLAYLSNNLVTSNFYQNQYNKFQNMIIPRVGFKKRMFYEIKTVFLSSIIVRLLIHIFTLIMIQFFFSRISFQGIENFTYLSNNPMTSLLLYILYSTIGFAIFSLFMYSLIHFIKNKYIYNVSGIIIMIILTVFIALIGNALYANELNIKLFNPLLEAFHTIALFTPGIESSTAITTLKEVHLYFWYTCMMFLVYSIFFELIGYRLKRKKG